MSKIAEIIQELNISPETLQTLAQRIQANPMQAMSILQELNIPPEKFQKLIATVMANPGELISFAQQMGMSSEQLDEVESKIENLKKQNSSDSSS
jgi:uncharacterized protein YukE